ncbi:MAG: hypothetical protein VKN56_09105 [Cyanobacteriota bacterium]|nr:hypothetical protein [Cyanobacteriota bacterium]
MVWDPSVLRRYSTTSHFRLLNQVRSELKSSPLARNQKGELSLGMARKVGSTRVPVEVRGATSSPRPIKTVLPTLPQPAAEQAEPEAPSFRDRLRAIEMR